MHKLSSILAKLKLPGPGELEQQQLDAAVAQTFGARADGLRVVSFKRGKLVLEARSAARAFEYQAFGRDGLVARMKELPGLQRLSAIEFKNGAWRTHGSTR